MPRRIDWEEIKKAYLEGDETYASLALRFGVGKSTIELKASEGKWRSLKDALQAGSKPLNPTNPLIERTRVSRKSQKLDLAGILEEAIDYFRDGLLRAEFKSAESCGATLVRLIETYQKVVPQTAEELIDIAIALDISPEEFIRKFADRWQERA